MLVFHRMISSLSAWSASHVLHWSHIHVEAFFLHRTTAKRLFADTEMGLLIIDECNSLSVEEFVAASSRCKAMIGIHDPGQNMRPVNWKPESSETDKIDAADFLAFSRAARRDCTRNKFTNYADTPMD